MSNLYKYLNHTVESTDYTEVNDFLKKNDIYLLKKDEINLYKNSKTFFSEIYGKKTTKKLDSFFKNNKYILAEDFTSNYEVKKGKIKYSKNKIQEKLKVTKNVNKRNILFEELENLNKKERKINKKRNQHRYDEGIFSNAFEKLKGGIKKWTEIPGKLLKIIFHKRIMQAMGIALAAVGAASVAMNPITWAIGALMLLIYYSYKAGGKKDPIMALKFFRTMVDNAKDKLIDVVKSGFDAAATFFKQPGVDLVVKTLLLGAKIVLSIAVNPIAFLVQFFSGLLIKSCISTAKSTITYMKSQKAKTENPTPTANAPDGAATVASNTASANESFYHGQKITPEMVESFLNTTENLKNIYLENIQDNILNKSEFLKANEIYFESSTLRKNINSKLTSTQKVKVQATVINHKTDENTKVSINLATNTVSVKRKGKKLSVEEIQKLKLGFEPDGDGNFKGLNNEKLNILIGKLEVTSQSPETTEAPQADANKNQTEKPKDNETKNNIDTFVNDFINKFKSETDHASAFTTLEFLNNYAKDGNITYSNSLKRQVESFEDIKSPEEAKQAIIILKEKLKTSRSGDFNKALKEYIKANKDDMSFFVDDKDAVTTDDKNKTENVEDKEKNEDSEEDKDKIEEELFATIKQDSTIDNLEVKKEKPTGDDILGYIHLKRNKNEANPKSKQYAADIYVKKIFNIKNNTLLSTFFEALDINEGFLKINSEPANIVVNKDNDKYSLSMKGSIGNFFSKESNTTKKGKIDQTVKDYLEKTIADVKTRTGNVEEYKNSKKQNEINKAIDDILANNLKLESITDEKIKEVINQINNQTEAEKPAEEKKPEEEKDDEKEKAAKDALESKAPFLEDEVALGTALFVVISAVAFAYHFFTGGLSNIPLDPGPMVDKLEIIIEQIASGQAYGQVVSFLQSLFHGGGASASMSAGTQSIFSKMFSSIGLEDTSDVDSGMMPEMDSSLTSVIMKKMDFISENEDLMSKLIVQKLGVKTFSEVMTQNPDFDLSTYINNLSTQEFAEITKNLSDGEMRELLNSPFGSQMQKGILDHLKDADPSEINTFNEKLGTALENSSAKEVYAELIKNKLAEAEYYDKFINSFTEKAEANGVINWFKEKIGMTDGDVEGNKLLKEILKDNFEKLDLKGLTPKEQYLAIMKAIKQSNEEDFINAFTNKSEILNKYPELKTIITDNIMENPVMLKKVAGQQLEEYLKNYDTSYITKALKEKAKQMGIPDKDADQAIAKIIKSITDPNDPFYNSEGNAFQKQLFSQSFNKVDGVVIGKTNVMEDMHKVIEQRMNFVATKGGEVPDGTWTSKYLQSIKEGGTVNPDAPIPHPDAPNPDIPEPYQPTPAPNPSPTPATDQPTPAPNPAPTTTPDQPAPSTNTTTTTTTTDQPTPNTENPATPEVAVESPILNDTIMSKLSGLDSSTKGSLLRTAEEFKYATHKLEWKKQLIKELNMALGGNQITDVNLADADKIINKLEPSAVSKAAESIGNTVSKAAESIGNTVNKAADFVTNKIMPDSYEYEKDDKEFLINEYFRLEDKLNKFKK